MFRFNRVFPGIVHIQDNMGVCFTLLAGSEKAVVIDTGYGLENVRNCISSLTNRPVLPLLTHGHHDHVLGARWFAHAVLDSADLEEYALRTGREQREKVAEQARGLGLTTPEDFMTAPVPGTEAPEYNGETAGFACQRTDLGGMEINIIHVPGHTAGSLVIHVPACQLLLTGDDWNPCTWMWFPCSLPVQDWLGNMHSLLRGLEQEGGVTRVLCSHQPMMREGKELKEFLAWATPERLDEAEKSEISSDIRVRRISDTQRGWELLFDGNKYEKR